MQEKQRAVIDETVQALNPTQMAELTESFMQLMRNRTLMAKNASIRKRTAKLEAHRRAV